MLTALRTHLEANMKKQFPRLWLPMALAVLLTIGIIATVVAANPDEPPEFYFTRLVYTQNSAARGGFGFRSGYTMSKPEVQYTCPEFGGRSFFPPQGWGWATDYPGADCKFMGGIHRLTGMRVDPNPNVIAIMDEELFKFP
jgi:hypothetical protein